MAGDRREYLELLRTNAEFHRPWSPAVPPGVDPYADEVFERVLGDCRSETSSRTLLCRKSDGVILGSFNLNQIVRGAFECAFLGYWVGAPHQGQGYMTEGMRLLLRHAFQRVRLHRVEANIIPSNRPSRALAKSAGFRCEGLSPRYLKIAGRWQDHERWAITVEDYTESGSSRNLNR